MNINNFIKFAEEASSSGKSKTRLSNEELDALLPTDDALSKVGDILISDPRQGYRAAIANSLATAAGKENSVSFTVKYPLLSSVLYSLGGSALGALGGGALGSLAGHDNIGLGAVLGSALGGTVGAAASNILRRNNIVDIKDLVKDTLLNADKIEDTKNSAILNPAGAIYNADILGTKLLLKQKEKSGKPITEDAYNRVFGSRIGPQLLYHVPSKILPFGTGSVLSSILYPPARLWGTRDAYRDQLGALA